MRMTATLSKVDSTPAMLEAVRLLTKRKVLVGFPKSTDERDPVATKQGKKVSRPTSSKPAITNAALAYIHDQGSPLQGIPQREFMRPGIMDGRDKITPQLLRAGRASMRGDKLGVEFKIWLVKKCLKQNKYRQSEKNKSEYKTTRILVKELVFEISRLVTPRRIIEPSRNDNMSSEFEFQTRALSKWNRMAS